MKKFLLVLCGTIFSLNLVGCGNSNGTTKRGDFYDLESSFNSGLISKDDLLNICYRNNDNHLYNDEQKEIQLTTENIYSLAILDEKVKGYILYDFYLTIKDDINYKESNITPQSPSIDAFCGVYGDYYAVRFYDLLNWPAIDEFKKIGDYNFLYPYKDGNEVVLWKNKGK